MQMAAPRATINTVPSYGSSVGVGYFQPTSAFPTFPTSPHNHIYIEVPFRAAKMMASKKSFDDGIWMYGLFSVWFLVVDIRWS